jgi:hypothetical protein
MEALTSLAVSLGPAFEPYAPAVFERTMQLLKAQHTALEAQVCLWGMLGYKWVYVLHVSPCVCVKRPLPCCLAHKALYGWAQHLYSALHIPEYNPLLVALPALPPACRLLVRLLPSPMMWTYTWQLWTYWQVRMRV